MSSEADHDGLDRALLERVAHGERAAFRDIVTRHQTAIFRMARLLTPDLQSAEDVLQETFVSALRGAAGFRGEASVRTWLLRIARNTAHRQRRRQRPELADDASLEQLGADAGWGAEDDPEHLVAEAQRAQQLARALDRLSPEDREVLVLRDLEGLSGEQTAFALGATVAAMKSRLHRARLRFAAAVRKELDDGA